MTIPYRTRKAFKNLGIFCLVLVVVAVFVLLCWLLWLDRFLVYTQDGAYLDFSQSNKPMSGQLAVPTEPRPTVGIHYGDDDVELTTELLQLNGFYITESDLSAPKNSKNPQEASAQKIDALIAKIRTLPPRTAVMLDVKSIKGRFFYNSSISSNRSSSINAAKVDELISVLSECDMYPIARLPAFRDYYFGLNNVPAGLHHTSGAYLWMDAQGCYWLNPTHQRTTNYLAQILTELRALGFREAVFRDFCFPETDKILFKDDKVQALTTAASTLVTICSTDTFAVSFISDVSFSLPEGRSRLYLEGIAATDCVNKAEQSGLANPQINLVFFAESHDTRYDAYSVLRPLAAES